MPSHAALRERERPIPPAPEVLERVAAAALEFETDPYPDYELRLTPEGGILVTYKTVDDRLRHKIVAAFLWLAATAVDSAVLLAYASGLQMPLLIAGWIVAALLNLIIVMKPIEVYRTIEIRPDCMILDGSDTFFLRHMQGEWPQLEPRGDRYVLAGIYGTRFVEFLSLPVFDENDRAPAVLALHLGFAMEQQWGRPTADPASGQAPRPARSRDS